MGVYVGGSYALGDYLPGRSDIDLAAVVRSSLTGEIEEASVATLRHEALPCPARLLEFVVYRLDTASSGLAESDFELNLNTGEGVPLSVQSRRETGDLGSHWYAIDRSVLSQAGIAVVGPPADEVFAPIPPRNLIPIVIESQRWHRERATDASDAVLNACRALRYAEEERWWSKPAAGRWAVARGLAPGKLISRALHTRTEGSGLDRTQVASFLTSVEAHLRASVHSPSL